MMNTLKFSILLTAMLTAPTLMAVEEITYEKLDNGSLQLSDGRTVSLHEYHMMPDGSLMLNDGTPLFEPANTSDAHDSGLHPAPHHQLH